jgi:Na+/H+ antiporter NhaA
MWYFVQPGIHATVTGVLIKTPFGDVNQKIYFVSIAKLYTKPVAFPFILPLFALANTAIVIGS